MNRTKLREAREKIPGLTQAEIAKKAGITTRAYQIYEAGERKPKTDVAIRVADALGVKSYQDFKKLFS